MTATPNAPDPLVQFGFSPQEAAAFRVLWGSRYLAYFLEAVPDLIHNAGGTPEDAVAYIGHAIDEDITQLFFTTGFTVHQAAIVQEDAAARSNLLGGPPARAVGVVEADVPRDFLVNVLRVAKSPEEVDRYIERYERAVAGEPIVTENGSDSVRGITDEVAVLAGLHPQPDIRCNCP